MEREIVDYYLSGANYKQVKARFGTSPDALRTVLEKHGVSPRSNMKRHILSNEQKLEAVKMYSSGKTIAVVAELFNVSGNVIHRLLRTKGVIARKEGWGKFAKDAELRKKIVEEFQNKKSLTGLAKKYGSSRDAICWALKREGMSNIEIFNGLRFVFENKDGTHVFMKSENEVSFAHSLDAAGLHWRHEPETFQSLEGRYTPDFIIYHQSVRRFIIDVKGFNSSFSQRVSGKSRSLRWIKSMCQTVAPEAQFCITNPTNAELVAFGIAKILNQSAV